MSYTPPSISFNVSVSPGLNGSPFGFPSYFDLTIRSSTSIAFPPTLPSGSLIDAWCLDRDIDLFVGPLPPTVFYTGNLYSTAAAELGFLNAAMPQLAGGLAGLNQLDSVNWLLNSYYKGTLGANGIWQNVQGAVWALIGDNPSVALNNDITGGNQAAISALTAQALLPVANGGGDGYVADQGQQQYLGVVVDPRLVAPGDITGFEIGQPLIIPTLAAKLGDFVWNDLNANGLQDGNEPGFNGVTVTLFRDLNNSGAYEAGDLLLGTKLTGPNGYYEFNGLTPGLPYQVQFTLPNGYAFTTRDVIDGNPNPDTRDSDANIITGAVPPVSLAPGEFNSTLDAGLVFVPPNARLGNWVWVDKNADGIQQAGENGLNGVTVNLRNALTNAIIDTKVTGAGTDDPTTPGDESVGYYEFGGLTPGVGYKVEFVNPDNSGPDAYIFSPRQAGGTPETNSDAAISDTVVLASGEFNRTIDAGLYRPGSIHPFAYLDNNGDGTQNGGDGPFPFNPGKTFVLKNANGVVVFQGNTDGNGEVHIEGLTPGTYKLSELVPAGYQYSGLQTIERTFTITSGEELVYRTGAANLGLGDGRTEVNLGLQLTWGNTQQAKLGDWVWVDKNADGIQQGTETGLNGVTVNLRDAATNAILQTKVTGAGTDDPTTPGNEAVGYYEFSGLTPGVGYKVEFISPDTVGPDAFLFSPRQAGGTVATNSDAAISDTVVLTSGEFNRSIDAGLYQRGSIHAFGFLDINGDGIRNGGDTAFPNDPGKTFLMTGPNGFSQSVKTGTNGAIIGQADWTSLTPGQYTITETPIPGGYALTTTPNTRIFTVESGQELVYTPGAANLPGGDTRTEVNIGTPLTWGNTQLAKLGDWVWVDKNADGIQQGTETGLNGVTVNLRDAVTNAILQTKVTGAGSDDPTTPGNESVGYYEFSGLTPGVGYKVEFISPDTVGPDAFLFSPRQAGGTVFTNSDAAISDTVVLTSGEFNRSIDAGLYQKGSIHAFGFLDINGDGIRNGGDSAFPNNPGKTFLLTGPNGFSQSVTTGTNGAIIGQADWTSLTPGQYTITETPIPNGYALTTTPNTRNFTVESGQELVYTPGAANLPLNDTRTEVNIGTPLTWGNTQLAKLGDFVWLDSNNNGLQEANEAGINGVTVRLINTLTNAVLATTTTGAGSNDGTTPGNEAVGYYEFAGLTPGVGYTVEFVKPTGTNFTTANVNNPASDAIDSDANTVTGRSQSVTLTSGEFNRTIDAGISAPPPGIEIIKDVVGTTFVAPNTPVTFTYTVRNTGGVELSNITVKDDNATPAFAPDDFNPTPVLKAGGFNTGDTDSDNKLDTGELWRYSATVIPPYNMSVSVATGSPFIDSGTLTYKTLANGDIRVFYLQDKNFNDNTYGTGSDSGWTSQGKTHTFGNLTGSDKAGFELRGANGAVLLKFYQDYITASTTQDRPTDANGNPLATGNEYASYSGFRSLGVTGGEGEFVTGGTLNGVALTQGLLYDFDTTTETSLNQPGTSTASNTSGVAYTAMTVNSPINDSKWDNVNGYSFTVKSSAFASAGGFGGVVIFDQHNSPAKVGGSNTYIPVVKGGGSVNTAVVTGTPPSGPPVTDDDPATVIIVNGPLGSLGDRVWLDSDADGVQDAGEAGIVGAKVTLTGDFDNNGSVDYTATMNTGANGIYSFGSLPAGTYKVAVDPTTLGGTYSQTFDLDGIVTANIATATLATGQNRTDVDFGYVGTNPGFTLDKIADKATVVSGASVTYTYTVRNTTGATISNVVLRDDNATPNQASDDFNPTRQLDVTGDNDNLLEAGEVWRYTATVVPPVIMTVTIGTTVYDSGSLTYTTLPTGDIRVDYLQSTNFNDNTYGVNSEGWAGSKNGTHTFKDLVGSDKAGFDVKFADGTSLVKFYQDYISLGGTNTEGYAAFSGYQSLGITGGEGEVLAGNSGVLKDFDSTHETSLNRAGYNSTWLVDSPTDAGWNKTNGYSFVIDKSAFATKAFGGVVVFDQHNSPPKVGDSNTYIPNVVGGPSTNTAIVSGTWNGQQLVAIDAATVQVTAGGGGGGGGPAKFYVVDSGVDDVFPYTASGTGSTPFDLASKNTDGRGITGDAAGTTLWVLDKSKVVYVYGTNGSSKGSWTAGGLSTDAEGIAKDGNDMWIVTKDTTSVFWYDNAAANLSGSDNPERTLALASANNKPKGVTTDGNFLWVVEDDSANAVFRYSIQRDGSGNVTGITAAGSWTLDSKNTTPTGITLDPTGVSKSLWVVDSGTDTVYEYADALTRTTGSNIVASATFKLATANTTPQDIFDPMIDGISADAIVAESGLSFGDMTGPARSEVRLPSMSDLLGGDTLDSVLGVATEGRSADMSFRDMIDNSVSETSELLRRLTEAQRDSHLMTSMTSI